MKRCTLIVKVIPLILILLLLLPALLACGGSSDKTPSATEETNEKDPGYELDENGYIKDSLPSDLSFDREFLTLSAENQKWHFWAEKDDTTNVGKAVWQRNQTVEERLGIVLNWKHEPCYSGTEKNRFAQMVESDCKAGNEFDCVISYNLVPYGLANKGYCQNLAKTKYIDLSGPWWPSAFLDTMLYKEQIFALVNSCGVGTLSNLSCIYFNNTLLEDRQLESPYELVPSNQWTLEKMKELVKDTYVDVNQNKKVDKEDFFGVSTSTKPRITCWYYGAGVRFSSLNEAGELELIANDVEAISSAVNGILDLFSNQDAFLVDNNSNKMFLEQRTLFYLATLNLATVIQEIDYGVAPIPKLNSAQSRYYTHVPNTHDAWFLPTGVKDPDCSSAFIECMASEAYRQVNVVYYETNLKLRYAPDDRLAQMYDLIRESITFDFVYIYKTVFNEDCDAKMLACIENPQSTNWATTWGSIGSSVSADFEKLLAIYEKD